MQQSVPQKMNIKILLTKARIHDKHKFNDQKKGETKNNKNSILRGHGRRSMN